MSRAQLVIKVIEDVKRRVPPKSHQERKRELERESDWVLRHLTAENRMDCPMQRIGLSDEVLLKSYRLMRSC